MNYHQLRYWRLIQDMRDICERYPAALSAELQEWLLRVFSWDALARAHAEVYASDLSHTLLRKVPGGKHSELYEVNRGSELPFVRKLPWRYAFPTEQSYLKCCIKPFWEDLP